jgi:anthranilate/para-aminobenzoate synthase component II
MPERFEVGLYHSWAVALAPTNPLKAIAYSSEQVLMAVEHPTVPLFGVQFHPESVMTPMGKQILHNFLKFS